MAISIAFFAAPAVLSGWGGSAAPAPDWRIDTPRTIEDTTYTADGSVVVAAGGTLTLRNATLLFNLAESGGLRLAVETGGALIIQNSTLRASDAARAQGLHWNFLVSGRLEVRGADISDMRGDAGLGGLEIDSTDALVEDSFIHNNRYYGLFLRSGAPIVRRTTFDANVVGVFVLPGASPVLEDLVIKNSTGFGLKINDGSPVVRNLTVTGSGNFAVGAVGGILDIVGCRLSGGQVGLDAVLGTTGTVRDCEFLSFGTGVRAQDSPIRVENSTFFGDALGVNATRSAVELESNRFVDIPLGVRVQDAPGGVFGGEAVGNDFTGSGVAIEVHIANFFLDGNTYGPSVTGTRVFHRMTLLIVDKSGAAVPRARVNITAADGALVFTGLTNDTGAVEAALEEFREFGDGTRQNLTPHAVRIENRGLITEASVNATSDRTATITLGEAPPPLVFGVTREALLLIAAVFGAAALLGAFGMRARRRSGGRRADERSSRGRQRRGPRSGR